MDYQNNKFLHKNVFKFMSMFVELSNKLQPFIYYLAEFIRAPVAELLSHCCTYLNLMKGRRIYIHYKHTCTHQTFTLLPVKGINSKTMEFKI